MEVKRFPMPDGRACTFYKGDDQTWSDIIQNTILPRWIEYCYEHWLSANHEDIYAPEKRVKAFLDRCGWMFLQDNPKGLESAYKAMSHMVREIPVTECPSEIADSFYSENKPYANPGDDAGRFDNLCSNIEARAKRGPSSAKRKYKETRFDRIAKLIKEQPNSNRKWCSVNADNDFEYNGMTHHIPFGVSGYVKYADKETTDAMDRILVVENEGKITYYDQNVLPLAVSL